MCPPLVSEHTTFPFLVTQTPLLAPQLFLVLPPQAQQATIAPDPTNIVYFQLSSEMT